MDGGIYELGEFEGASGRAGLVGLIFIYGLRGSASSVSQGLRWKGLWETVYRFVRISLISSTGRRHFVCVGGLFGDEMVIQVRREVCSRKAAGSDILLCSWIEGRGGRTMWKEEEQRAKKASSPSLAGVACGCCMEVSEENCIEGRETEVYCSCSWIK